MTDTFRIAAMSGSLRHASYNRGLLRAAQATAPAEVTIEILEVDLPLFNEDLEEAEPASVALFKKRVHGANAVLIATPEYNWGIPGGLKNAIDWCSRPPARNVLKQKPVAILGATTGPWGTTRAQNALRQTLIFTDSLTLVQPWVFVNNAKEKFDDAANLTDERTKEQVAGLVAALVAWTKRLG
ncbi:MAG: NAD(P)H-dependent oxidoreductase [Chloroflexi bacterium]|nr:NAD(P)H-dependent oxidoreductase [Chloroflexota bacterium]